MWDTTWEMWVHRKCALKLPGLSTTGRTRSVGWPNSHGMSSIPCSFDQPHLPSFMVVCPAIRSSASRRHRLQMTVAWCSGRGKTSTTATHTECIHWTQHLKLVISVRHCALFESQTPHHDRQHWGGGGGTSMNHVATKTSTWPKFGESVLFKRRNRYSYSMRGVLVNYNVTLFCSFRHASVSPLARKGLARQQ